MKFIYKKYKLFHFCIQLPIYISGSGINMCPSLWGKTTRKIAYGGDHAKRCARRSLKQIEVLDRDRKVREKTAYNYLI